VPDAFVSCPTCHAQLDANARFCPKDGTTIRPDSVLIDVRAVAGTIERPPPPPAPPPASRGAEAFKATVAMQPKRKRRTSTATTDPASDALIGKLLDGRYRVRGRLGQGGVGAVYDAEHVQMKKQVAVKVLHPLYASTDEFRKRFEREARAASRLSHPSIVQVTDFGRVNTVEPDDPKLAGIPYLVMEFVKGQVLLDRLIEGPPIAPAEAVVIARDTLGALQHAHELGIVHRDIKPANIMVVSGEGTGSRVKLLDFGLAKELLAEGDAPDAPLTQAGMVFGTPGYLSPEQAAGRKIDARADLYSVGVLLFEMSCNRRLFEREDPLDAVRDHLHTPPPDPRSINAEISPPLSKVILKALEKDRTKRFDDANAFAAALAACPEATGARANLPIWKRTAWGRPLWLWSALGAGALLVIAGVVIALSSGKQTKTPVTATPAGRPASAPSLPAAMAPGALKHLELAASYQRKLWCSDTIEELERAVHEDPRLRADPEVAHLAIACMRSHTVDRASRFLVERLGESARAELESAASGETNAEIRKNAQRVLEKLPR
jgi:serine/threonine-protein kinase